MPSFPLAPRLRISLPLSGLLIAARMAGQDAAGAALAAALIGAMLAPAARPLGIAGAAVATGGATALWVAHPGMAEAVLAALPLAGNLALAWHFGATLRPGRDPLITRYTRFEHAEVSAGLARYTRRLTLLWAGFFLLCAAVNAATLAGHGPAAGPFAVFNLGLAAAFFLGEHLARAVLFPELGRARPSRTLRAVWRAEVVPHAH
ncbi:hypothetical protein GXW74_19675 [Roseomonas eburnea]|uniref:Ketosynthase n=1 Tax=Neoroseomonas eburnea TaxID=1346889 RepID=A0A9X9XG85_9PROT|nr:hypothetical protein [Neoroseomonas eburnea]MBR0682721.1 hypothetical protein [Neoroseomonas eburnea]